jgi:hypothetical protein
LLIAFGLAGERQAGSDFPVPTFALPRKVAFSLTTSRGASMSPRSVQLAWSSQRSVTKILPSTVPRIHAHRDDGKRFVVHADEKLTAFLELEAAIQTVRLQSHVNPSGL